MSLVDVPYETFIHNLLPHLDIKDIGYLAMTCKDLLSFCDEQDMWKLLYLRTVPWKITDESVHLEHDCLGRRYVSTDDSNNWSWSNRDILHHRCGCRGTCWSDHNLISDKIRRTAQFSDNAFQMPQVVFRHIQWGYLPPDTRVPTLEEVNRNKERYLEMYVDEWVNMNDRRGLSRVNLCQDPSHYVFESLDMPRIRKYKSYKHVTLGKLLTQEKKPLKQIRNRRIKYDHKIIRTERELERLKGEREKVYTEESRIMRLVSKLSLVTRK